MMEAKIKRMSMFTNHHHKYSYMQDDLENGDYCFYTDVKETVERLEAKIAVVNNFKPTSEQINNLPEPLRKYIHDLATICDPSGMVQEIAFLKETVGYLEAEANELPKTTQQATDQIP